jgi:hypothetical protein
MFQKGPRVRPLSRSHPASARTPSRAREGSSPCGRASVWVAAVPRVAEPIAVDRPQIALASARWDLHTRRPVSLIRGGLDRDQQVVAAQRRRLRRADAGRGRRVLGRNSGDGRHRGRDQLFLQRRVGTARSRCIPPRSHSPIPAPVRREPGGYRRRA